jgi:transcription elongation GreA/GreB family factor
VPLLGNGRDFWSAVSARRAGNTQGQQLAALDLAQGRAQRCHGKANAAAKKRECFIEVNGLERAAVPVGTPAVIFIMMNLIFSRCLPFIMDKFLLQQQVLERLAEDLLQAEQALRAAHETATHEENIAENKYDTLGLEAAYLATGQARRAEAIRQAMANWRQFRPRPYDASKGIQLGALVCLVDSDDKQQQLFLGPDGGSMKLVSGAQLVQVISSEAPLGRAMLGKCEGDEVSIQVAPSRQQFEVLRVH